MQMQQIILVAGVPGAGKTTFAKYHAERAWHYGLRVALASADDYFEDEAGNYAFDPTLLGEAHAACQSTVRAALAIGSDMVIVHNTLLSAWEREPYLVIAREFNAEVRIHVLDVDPAEAAKRNVHGVPFDRVIAMAERLDLPVGEHVLLEGAPA